MINDFIAAGYGVASLSTDEYVQIGSEVKAEPKGPIAVVGPGTGLGEAYLVNVNGSYEPYPSEGGHADLAVQTLEDFKILEFTKKFIVSSDNVENSRTNEKELLRVST